MCSSLYGLVTWNLLNPEVNRVCTSGRNALRKIWCLAPSSHCDIVSALGSERTMFDELCHRPLKFIMFCLIYQNCNSTVNFIVRNSLFFCGVSSALGRHFLHISHRYTFSPSLICNPSKLNSIMSNVTNFCKIQFEKVCTPSFMLLYSRNGNVKK